MKAKIILLFTVLFCLTIFAPAAYAYDIYWTTVDEVGIDTANGVTYVRLTDVGGSFTEGWFTIPTGDSQKVPEEGAIHAPSCRSR